MIRLLALVALAACAPKFDPADAPAEPSDELWMGRPHCTDLDADDTTWTVGLHVFPEETDLVVFEAVHNGRVWTVDVGTEDTGPHGFRHHEGVDLPSGPDCLTPCVAWRAEVYAGGKLQGLTEWANREWTLTGGWPGPVNDGSDCPTEGPDAR